MDAQGDLQIRLNKQDHTNGSYCASNLPSASHQNIMCILVRYDLPEKPNRLLPNKRKVTRTAYGMVSAIRAITVFGYAYSSASKIMGAYKYASTMMHVYTSNST